MTEPERPSEAAPLFGWPIPVYYEDTDAGGMKYRRFFERARTEWLRACGLDQRCLAAETGAMFVVRDPAIDYRGGPRGLTLSDERQLESNVSGAPR